MESVSLVTSVPDLHTARICAAAGVPMISLVQTHPNLIEIRDWLEGTEVFVQITDPDLPLPLVDHLIIPFEWYDAFSFIDKKVFWITADQMISRPDGMIYTSLYQNPPPTGQDLKLFPYYEGSLCAVWLDYQSDYKSFERLFLS
ncbi:MAG: hypothetical protein IPK94_19755 [Saprospiraceae bacterium]|nr:hypothetical protein [Saprospiraceae bacterium]MBK8510878.1 hypothetical protein [Saprospiraceae bacterium]